MSVEQTQLSNALNTCFHCQLENPTDSEFKLSVLGEERLFCCPGCLAVAEMICSSGQQDFYRFRTESNHKVEEILPQEILEFEAYDNHQIAQEILESGQEVNRVNLGIEGITCAACGWLLKKQLMQLNSVQSIEVNTTTKRAQLVLSKESQLSEIFKRIRELGYRAFPYSEDSEEASAEKEDKAFVRRLIVAGLAMMQVMMFATGLYIGDYQDIAKEHAFFLHSVSGLLATPVVFYSALPFLKSAIRGLRFGHVGMNVPVSIAIFAAYFSSVYSLLTNGTVFYFDSVVMFTFFLLLGRYLEHHVRFKALLKQQNFRKLLPFSVILKNTSGEQTTVPIAQVKVDDCLLINAGTVIPVDGVLASENASLDEAVISGESLPLEKTKGETVYSGSTNAGASFEMIATSDLTNSRLQKLISLQDKAENLTSNRVSLADKIASWYVIVLLILSIITGFVWYQINPEMVFPVVLSLLVVSCPCALSLATPAAFASAIAKLTDKGIMIKSSNTLSKLSQISTVIFDKTGTLTTGRFTISRVNVLADIPENRCLEIASALESVSNHPLSEAFRRKNNITELEASEVIAGGIEGRVGSDIYRIGKKEFVSNVYNEPDSQSTATNHIGTSVFLSKNNQFIAEFVLSDRLNKTAKDAVAGLKQKNINTEILSGDNEAACSTVSKELGIGKFLFNTNPEQKLDEIERLTQSGQKCLMIGDGVNDIGAFKAANVAITMGDASHLSKTTSDAVLVSHDLRVVPFAIDLSKRLDKIIKQNLSWAVAYNLIAIPFAIVGLVPAWLAAIGMTSSSLIVVLNALRLRK